MKSNDQFLSPQSVLGIFGRQADKEYEKDNSSINEDLKASLDLTATKLTDGSGVVDKNTPPMQSRSFNESPP